MTRGGEMLRRRLVEPYGEITGGEERLCGELDDSTSLLSLPDDDSEDGAADTTCSA